MDRLYCTYAEVVADLNLMSGEIPEDRVMRFIRTASSFIDRRIGRFFPVTETRWFDGTGRRELVIDPIISASAVTDDGVSILATQYILYPRSRAWEYGPYYKLVVDPDAVQLSCWTDERDSVSITGQWGMYSLSEATGETVQNATKITASGTSLQVANKMLVSPGMVLKIEDEQILVEKSLAEPNFQVKRGVNGTTAAEHLNGTAISRLLVPDDVNHLAREMTILALKKAETGFSGRGGNLETGEMFYFKEFPQDVIKEVQANYRVVTI